MGVSLISGPAALAAEAPLAELSVTKGQVLVNRGNGYTAVRGSTPLAAGDRVIVTDGEARLSDASGCKVTLPSQSMLTVSKEAACVSPKSVEMVAADLADRRRGAAVALPPAAAPVGVATGVIPYAPALFAVGAGAVLVGVSAAAGNFDNEGGALPISP